ncbi:hypothetical protein [Thiomicrospira sp. WB1]|uniref:hypothetical protein n=1 Tax=Thiomicrospira sp. WB1 TaxID=1685380 RepID=UPI000749FEB1|nr:hypothetical protein [Thiomicrospira sp. WB1]KUJ71796.1 hypothetical protein AVO41_04855 [Thiomicrospira sp. WB1]
MAQSNDPTQSELPPQTDNDENTTDIPDAETMLKRLQTVNVDDFDLRTVTDEVKGNQAWLFAMTLPMSALLLVSFTLLGAFLSGHFVLSFLVTAFVVYGLGKLIDQYEQKFRYQARLEVMDRIRRAEGEFGLVPHFRDFLPKKYRHLWQSLRRYNYAYIDQYIAAIRLLQQRLDPDKFIRVWRLKYPETAPLDEDDDSYDRVE